MLKELRDILKNESLRATFACGGTIPVRNKSSNLTPKTSSKVKDGRLITQPIIIRFGPSGTAHVLALPEDHNGEATFETLIKACQPASFGLEGKDVYYETYRKATMLDPIDFCTDFCPSIFCRYH